jgi:hypothetical protein
MDFLLCFIELFSAYNMLFHILSFHKSVNIKKDKASNSVF